MTKSNQRKHGRDDWKNPSMYKDFPNCNRYKFPKGIVRVTAGFGGEALLILGSEKTAIYDCGMAYCGLQLVRQIIEVMRDNPYADGSQRDLDYIFVSHTHYDHVGGLPYLKNQWPEAIVFGSAYGQHVLSRKGAKETIRTLGEAAAESYSTDRIEPILMTNLEIDQVLQDREEVSLGEERIVALETKGHTNCTMTYVLEPAGIMIASESTGVLEGEEEMHVAILKSYKDCMASLEKCRSYKPNRIISPHYGIIPKYYNDKYWKLFERIANKEKDFVDSLWEKGGSMEDMIQAFKDENWIPERAVVQPLAAFLVNAECTIRAYEPK